MNDKQIIKRLTEELEAQQEQVRRLTVIIEERDQLVVDEVKQLREKLKKIESDASFYFSSASDKATMKYGLSKVRKLAQQ